jgi:hypothetical protein
LLFIRSNFSTNQSLVPYTYKFFEITFVTFSPISSFSYHLLSVNIFSTPYEFLFS